MFVGLYDIHDAVHGRNACMLWICADDVFLWEQQIKHTTHVSLWGRLAIMIPTQTYITVLWQSFTHHTCVCEVSVLVFWNLYTSIRSMRKIRIHLIRSSTWNKQRVCRSSSIMSDSQLDVVMGGFASQFMCDDAAFLHTSSSSSTQASPMCL